QGLPKGEKLEAIVEKGTEVGVTHFLPVETERSVVRLSEDRAERRRSRCARVAQAAAKQCGRAVAPAILPFATLEEAAAAKELEGLTLIAFWEEATTPLNSIVRRLESDPDGEGV